MLVVERSVVYDLGRDGKSILVCDTLNSLVGAPAKIMAMISIWVKGMAAPKWIALSALPTDNRRTPPMGRRDHGMCRPTHARYGLNS